MLYPRSHIRRPDHRSGRRSAFYRLVPERLERRWNGPRSGQIGCQSSVPTVVEQMEH
jgi:hypothetical protein